MSSYAETPQYSQGAPYDPKLAAAFAAALHALERRRQVVPRIQKVASPAAGVDWTIQVPGGSVWIPLSIRAQFVTDGNVANRYPRLNYGDGTTTYSTIIPAGPIAASSTVLVSWARGYGGANNQGVGVGQTNGLPNIPIPGSEVLTISTVNLQAGDQWSLIALKVLEMEWRTFGSMISAMQNPFDAAPDLDNYPGMIHGI